jgi:hypothetical protein
MLSKIVRDRATTASALAATLRDHARTVGARAENLFAPYMRPGESMPDLGLVCHLLARRIEARSESMMQADDAHRVDADGGLEDDEKQDRAEDEVTRTLLEIRAVADAIYGREWSDRMSLPDRRPHEPGALAALGKRVARALDREKRPKRSLAESWARGLKKPLRRLVRTARRHEGQTEAETAGTRRAARARFDDTLADTVALAATLLALAGEHQVAGTVRASRAVSPEA